MKHTPRQRVLQSLAHIQPTRIPFSWGFGPTPEMTEVLRKDLAQRGIDWDRLQLATEDVRYIAPQYTGPMPPNGNTFIGIWGINVTDVSYSGGSYQEFTDFPLANIEDPRQLDNYPWPNADHYDYANLRASVIKEDPERRMASKFFAGNPFEIYSWMTGLEQAMVNTAIHPEVVHAAMDRITKFFMCRLEHVLQEVGDLLDIVFIADDLGGQTGLLMSNQMYRELLQPYHRRFTTTAHTMAPHTNVMFHSDGAVFDILPDLLDAGIHILEAVQTEATGMEPQRLKDTFGKRMSFHGAISVQQVLPRLSADGVRDECQRLVTILGNGGGYIAAPSHAIQVGTPTENVLAMLETVLGTDDFETALAIASSSRCESTVARIPQ